MKKALLAALVIYLEILALGQGKIPTKRVEEINVDFMLRGYFYASSPIKDWEAFGGFGTSLNTPHPVTDGKTYPKGEISLIAEPKTQTIFAEKYKGLRVILVNMTDRPVAFQAQDSRLYITQEALDIDGKWKPVEYLPWSWCGNSYHKLILGPRQYWKFSAARFSGKMKTRFRFRLDSAKSRSHGTPIYSNEFEGSLNKEQFTNQRPYSPNGIMDPYLN